MDRRRRSPTWATPHLPVAEAVAALLAPHGEVVLHDLRTARIVAIFNPMSGRAVGDDSLVEELDGIQGSEAVLGPYEKVLPDGRRTTSVTAVLRDGAGTPQGLLCVNVDRSPLDQIAALAATLLGPRVPQPPELFHNDWRERLAVRVDELCRERALRRDQLDRAARRELVARLDAEGLFAVRGAADTAALALGVSRATVYSLLKETRS
jgi:D-arginine utilization repressor